MTMPGAVGQVPNEAGLAVPAPSSEDAWPVHRAYNGPMGIRDVTKHGHPLVRAGVFLAAAVLVVLLVMTAVSVVVGLLWTLIKIVVFVLLVAGIFHIWSRHRAANRN